MSKDYKLTINITKILFLLTNRCNLVCKHCYVSSHPNGNFGVSLERSFQLIDEIYKQFGKVSFAISGGEALSRRDDCLAIIKYADEKLKVSLNTNATLLTSSVAKQLADSTIDLIISLDGAKASTHDYLRGKGSFNRSITGIRTLLNLGFPSSRIHIVATIPPENINEINDVLALAAGFGLRSVRVDSLTKAGRANEFWPSRFINGYDYTLSKFLDKLFSTEFTENYIPDWKLIDLDAKYAQFDTLNIYSDGNVYLYTPLTSTEIENSYIGNINEESLANIVCNSHNALQDIIFKKFIEFARCRNKSSRSFLFLRND